MLTTAQREMLDSTMLLIHWLFFYKMCFVTKSQYGGGSKWKTDAVNPGHMRRSKRKTQNEKKMFVLMKKLFSCTSCATFQVSKEI